MIVNGLVCFGPRWIPRIAALSLVAGCGHERVLSAARDYQLLVTSGEVQTAPAGSLLPRPLSVVVHDVAGLPVRGTIVVFRVTRGAASGAVVLDSLAVTNDLGVATADLRLGARPDTVEVLAFPLGVESRAVALRAIASGGPTLSGVLPASVGPGDTLALAGSMLGGAGAMVEIGPVRVAPVSGGDGELRVIVPACLPAGGLNVRVLNGTAWTEPRPIVFVPRRGPLKLKRFEVAVIGAGELASCATLSAEGGGAQYILVPQLASHAALPTESIVRVSAGGESLAALLGGTGGGAAWRSDERGAQESWDFHLREAERRLAPLARGAESHRPPLMALTVGSMRTFRVISDLDGEKFSAASGRLRWLGKHLGIYVDTAASGAFTETQLDQLGKLFDNDLYRTDVEAFGPESDIDRNDRVLVFLTPRVNALVPASDCGAKGFVTGFFYGRDLIPSLSNSNGGEIFYAMVPDPGGQYSCSHSAPDVMRFVPGTFVHEFQHMISFFHHVVARAGETETHWVNEGLSHIAEELVSRLFERRYPAPLGRSTLSQLFPDSASGFISPQMLNSYVYLNNSAVHSVTTFAGSGSIEERGAVWLFLRWLGDQKGEFIYQRLVQTSMTGVGNIEARAGEPFARLFGDFSIAVYADSTPEAPRNVVASRYRFLSRNLRQLMARQATVSGFSRAFPIAPVRVPFGGYAEGPIIPGTMVYSMLGPLGAEQGPAVLNFFRTNGLPFAPGEGAQIGVFRIR